MSNSALILERFDAAAFPPAEAASNGDDALGRARAEAYAAGLSAGKAAAIADSNIEEPAFISAAKALHEGISAAPDRIAEQAASALRILIEGLFPALAKAGFAIEAAEVFAKSIREAGQSPIEIRTSPEHADLIAQEIKRCAPGCALSVTGDDALDGAEAYVNWNAGGIDFNLDNAVRECLGALERASETIRSESKR